MVVSTRGRFITVADAVLARYGFTFGSERNSEHGTQREFIGAGHFRIWGNYSPLVCEIKDREI